MKNTFDQTTFSKLLMEAIGSRRKKDFASLIGISAEHLSRISNKKYSTPPSIDTLKKIATYAENNVTYQELLEACGYISEKDALSDFTLPIESVTSNRFVKATLLTALESLGTTWEVINASDATPYDLIIRINGEETLQWYFRFLSQKTDDQMKKQLSNNYLEVLFNKMKSSDKLSFVTCSRKEFDIYLDRLPENLNANISILLINESQLEIQEEHWLARALPYKNAIEKLLLSK